MYRIRSWIHHVIPAAMFTLVVAAAAPAQVQVWTRVHPFVAPDPARDLFNEGQRFFDEDRFAEAENRFRQVVRRFPRNAIADRADYYLIRTLVQVGKKNEALNRIDSFPRQYPKSRWMGDVQELRIQLTNQVPAVAESILLRVQAPAPSPAPPGQRAAVSAAPPPTVPAMPPAPSMPSLHFSFEVQLQGFDPEVSLQQEIMRAMFRNNTDRAIEIVTERLKANPADPVVLSSLNALASSRSAQAMPILLNIVKTSPIPRARRDAIIFLGQASADNDVIVDTLVGILPSLNDDDSEAVSYTLSRFRSDKSLNALAAIARDRSKTEKARTDAIRWIGQSRTPNRLSMLDDIYRNSTDNAKIRLQVVYALSRTREPQAVSILSNAASVDPDGEVRRQAGYWLSRGRGTGANRE
jgi:thioredoxin-like negative regulator of GroEL